MPLFQCSMLRAMSRCRRRGLRRPAISIPIIIYIILSAIKIIRWITNYFFLARAQRTAYSALVLCAPVFYLFILLLLLLGDGDGGDERSVLQTSAIYSLSFFMTFSNRAWMLWEWDVFDGRETVSRGTRCLKWNDGATYTRCIRSEWQHQQQRQFEMSILVFIKAQNNEDDDDEDDDGNSNDKTHENKWNK